METLAVSSNDPYARSDSIVLIEPCSILRRRRLEKLPCYSQILMGICADDLHDKSDTKVSHSALLCHQNMASRAVRPSPFARSYVRDDYYGNQTT